jgi:hypothetical protein
MKKTVVCLAVALVACSGGGDSPSLGDAGVFYAGDLPGGCRVETPYGAPPAAWWDPGPSWSTAGAGVRASDGGWRWKRWARADGAKIEHRARCLDTCADDSCTVLWETERLGDSSSIEVGRVIWGGGCSGLASLCQLSPERLGALVKSAVP